MKEFTSERSDILKKTIYVILLIAIMLSTFSVQSLADDNATSGDGDTHGALSGCGWYNTYQYMWKVTVFVGKSDTATKASSLTSDFYRIGSVVMKKSGWSVPSGTQFGSGTKIDFYNGSSLGYASGVNTISDSSCPAIPIVCSGSIDTVKRYFGSTGTMNTVLNAIASETGTTAYGLVSSRYFTIGGQTKAGWDESYLLPNGTENRVPWVIVYEPIIIIHCKDKTTKLAFTATHCAIAQLNGWYQWSLGDGSGQGISRLTSCHLPTSVQLEESWFGYPVYAVTDDSTVWSDTDIIKGGGWGMRWLPVSIYEETESEPVEEVDYGVRFSEVETPEANSYGSVSVYWKNYKDVEGSVLCELYLENNLIWSENKTFSSGQGISQTLNVYYADSSTKTLTARINYSNRNNEVDPNDNVVSVTFTPTLNESVSTKNSDYGCSISVGSIEPDSYGEIYVTWRNWTEFEGPVLCEIYSDSELLFSEYKTFEANEVIESGYTAYFMGVDPRTLTARINYENRYTEIDPNDNISSVVVTPMSTVYSSCDFSVSYLYVEPDPVEQGSYCTVDFFSDNWNITRGYNNVLVEVLVNDVVVKSDYVSFEPAGYNYHVYYIPMNESGTNTVTARINWNSRYSESNSFNNIAITDVEVESSYDFSVSNLEVRPTDVYENDSVTVTFTTDSWDQSNSHYNIPVEVLYDNKIVHTEYANYAIYGSNNHVVKLNIGTGVGSFPISVRVNWQERNLESDPNNNSSETQYVTVKPKLDLSIEEINPNSDYREGMTVITSYHIYNNSSQNIIPIYNNTVSFEAYYYNGSTKVVISSQTWKQAVIPAYDNNLVYFKWTVPSTIAGKTVYCKAVVNSENGFDEYNTSNNTATLTRTVAKVNTSQTPDTQYEETKPNGFSIPSAPSTSAGSATWSLWTYSNGNFVKKNYGVAISSTAPTITPDEDSPSAKYTSGQWQMRSGYGIYMNYAPGITSISGYTVPASSAYTSVQRVEAAFPEFKYAKTIGSFRSLEKYGGVWVFVRNTSADLNERLHFTPLWYPNGNYIVSVMATDVWTPAGMISSVRNSNTIKIVDSAYDDWYVGEG